MLRTSAAAVLILTASAGAQTASWKSVAPPGFNGSVNGISFPSKDTGFAVGAPSEINVDKGYILTSVDRGDHWTVRELDGIELYDVEFTSVKNGFAVGRETGCSCGLLYITSDGGKSWTPRTYPSATYLGSIDFVDKNIGFVAGSKATLLKTTDGGKNWNQVNTGLDGETFRFQNVFFPTPNVGYMIASKSPRQWANVILKSTDGGTSWTTIVDNGEDTETKPAYSQLFFINADLGFATGREGTTKTIYKTTDGGAHWTKVYTANAAGNLFSMGGIVFLNEQLGYASGDEGTLVRTTNGGESWKKETSGVNTALPAIEFLDDNTGIVGGLFGAFIKRSIPLLPTASVSSDEIDFGKVEAKKTMTVTVSAMNELGLRIDSIYIQNRPGKTSGFALGSPKGPFPMTVSQGTPLTVSVDFTPLANGETDVRADLVLKTNDPSRAYITVALLAEQGTVVSPAAQISATQLDFGDVQEGKTKELSFTLGAANSAGLRVTSATVVDAGTAHPFTIVEPSGSYPLDLVMGSPATFTIRFAPAAENQTVESRLEIETNDPANSKLSVTLVGKGTKPAAGVAGEESTEMRLKVEARPNPVGEHARLLVNVPAAGDLNVALYDIYGYKVAELFHDASPAGEIALPLESASFPNGIYYCIAKTSGKNAYCEITIAR